MTFKEKLILEHPSAVGDEHMGGCRCCPHDYDYEKEFNDSQACATGAQPTDELCRECWDRVIPGTDVDMVNAPPHYTKGMECIDEMIEVFGKKTVAHFCLCNVWKYRKRAIYKNGQEDMDKADWYMNKYTELMKSESMEYKLP